MKSRLRKRLEPLAFRWGGRVRGANHWMIGQAARGALAVLRRLPPEQALEFADRTARRLGPLMGRHRTALDNLRRAFPEKSPDEIEAIALDMWSNMARLAAEYIFLGDLVDLDPSQPGKGNVEVEGEEIFARIAAEKRPHILFTAHLGNFELLPVAAVAFGLEMTALFRPPNNPYIARYVFQQRESSMGGLLASQAGAGFALSRILDGGGNVGLLVDQRFQGGVPTTFFGRPCETNPLLAKLARHHDCDVYPARSIRLPGNRFRLEIGEKIDLPRTAGGDVDVNATCQRLNDIVEGWVREDPAQWMWFHKRWALSKRYRRAQKKRQSAQS
ncbi:MAG TPA: lipid A biosynthesis lauroyl acyltransferase [Mesorhizobium sp.]|jgi:KDO2-lipid IV(A) lauroyltransferase|nr:lipid A biosynthesis lauroyl acyltransferase [Mesorhizobium sp.]